MIASFPYFDRYLRIEWRPEFPRYVIGARLGCHRRCWHFGQHGYSVSACSVGCQPHDCDKDIEAAGDPRLRERKWNRCRIRRKRYFTFTSPSIDVARVESLSGDGCVCEDEIGGSREEQYCSVKRHQPGCKMILAHPTVANGISKSQNKRWRLAPQFRSAPSFPTP
jgi:hypothetical protein